MRTLAERLTWAIQRAGVKQADLARACGVREPSVSNWFKDQTKELKARPLLKAAAFLRVQPMWLGYGEGPRYYALESAIPSTTVAREPDPAPWPFEHIPPKRWQKLPVQDRQRIETYVEATMQAWEARYTDKSGPGTGTGG